MFWVSKPCSRFDEPYWIYRYLQFKAKQHYDSLLYIFYPVYTSDGSKNTQEQLNFRSALHQNMHTHETRSILHANKQIYKTIIYFF